MLTVLVAAILYVLVLSPSVVAKSYGERMKAAAKSDIKSVGRDFALSNVEWAQLEVRLHERSWFDIRKCRQYFTITLILPEVDEHDFFKTSYRDYYATPFSVKELRGSFAEEMMQQ